MDHKKNHGQEKEPQDKFDESEFINTIVKLWETFKKMSSISTDHPKFRSKKCKFWQNGYCFKGDQCTFAHDED